MKIKKLGNSLVIAFSMYSKIPMPQADWTSENKKYVMCLFPFIGVFIAGAMVAWRFLANWIEIGEVLQAIVLVMIPVALTGGIHMDGLMDTTDALASCQRRDRKLEILKDPHTGAFAVMACSLYLFLNFGVWYEILTQPKVTIVSLLVIGVGFIMSRALSAFAVVTFPLAKDSGLAAMFQKESEKRMTKIVCSILIFCCILLIVWVSPTLGGMGIAGAGIAFLYYYRMSKKQFGGITGDLAGYFLQICELLIAGMVMLGGKLFLS